VHTMYKNNNRNSSKFNSYSPLKLSCNLTGKYHAIGYYSYADRCVAYWESGKLLSETQ
jgi:hypothetical protein